MAAPDNNAMKPQPNHTMRLLLRRFRRFTPIVLTALLLPLAARAQTLAEYRVLHPDVLSFQTAPASPEDAVSNILSAVPNSASFSNTTFKVDLGLASVGIGQTGVEESYMRGTYNATATFGFGAEADFGAANVMNEAYGLVEARKVLSDTAEIYGVAAGGYSWYSRNMAGFVGFGTRIVPIQSIDRLAVQAELDVNIKSGSTQSPQPATRLLTGASWHF